MKITQEDCFQKTIFRIVPSSDKGDFLSLSAKIKKLKKYPFHNVYMFMPSELFFKNSKNINDAKIVLRQFQIKNNIAMLEVE